MYIFYLTPPIFFVIAFVFSMLGMGGSQLYIPILYWMGLDFKTEAVPLGMLLNVVNSSSAAFTYWRKKLIVWNVAIPF
ncbi:MAG: TSUP family transporter, partial [Anaerolineales bacterium]